MTRKDELLYSEYYKGKRIWFRRINNEVRAIVPSIGSVTNRTKKGALKEIKEYMRGLK